MGTVTRTVAAIRDGLLPKLLSDEVRVKDAKRYTEENTVSGDHIRLKVPIVRDEKGLTGRECPACQSFFKVEFGTGIQEEDAPCHCPYCGHQGEPSDFFTPDQVEYLKSVLMKEVAKRIEPQMKRLERKPDPRALFDFGIEVKINTPPIHYYEEPDLETEVVCDNCTLHYAIYGVVGYCPDCGVHNTLQMVLENLGLAERMVGLAATQEPDLADTLVASALVTCVSTFDGFGRGLVSRHQARTDSPGKTSAPSFQNLARVQGRFSRKLGVDIANGVDPEHWTTAVRAFQKRHLYAHKEGVIDEKYIQETGDTSAVVGQKVRVVPDEITVVNEVLKKVATNIVTAMGTEQQQIG